MSILSTLKGLVQLALLLIGWAKDESLKQDGRNQVQLENSKEALEVGKTANEIDKRNRDKSTSGLVDSL